MRALRSVVLVAALVAGLTGCVSTASLESEQSPSPSPRPTRVIVDGETDDPSCTRGGDTTLAVEQSIDGMPGVDRGPEYTAGVALFERGDGACVPAGTEAVNALCAPQVARDGVSAYIAPTEHMFAAGATSQIQASVSGRSTRDEQFLYRMSVWRFDSPAAAQKAPFVDAVTACDGVLSAVTGEGQRLELRDGDEPYLRLDVEGDRIFAFQSLRLSDAPGLRSTSSGLLPVVAVDHIEQWWRLHGTDIEPTEP